MGSGSKVIFAWLGGLLISKTARGPCDDGKYSTECNERPTGQHKPSVISPHAGPHAVSFWFVVHATVLLARSCQAIPVGGGVLRQWCWTELLSPLNAFGGNVQYV